MPIEKFKFQVKSDLFSVITKFLSISLKLGINISYYQTFLNALIMDEFLNASSLNIIHNPAA